MAKLADYGIVVSDTPTVTIKGHQFPILLTMETMEHIADIYDDDYSKFEEDMNAMLNKSGGRISSKELSASDLKIMRALIYGMLKTGGLDETPETIFKFLGMNSTVVEVYGACMEVFAAQNFQDVDVKKSKKPQDYQTPQQKKNKKKKLYACLGYMYLTFWAGSQVCSLHFFGVYGIQELDILFIFLLIVLLSSCGACTFWLYQARCSIQYIEKTSQKNNILINFFMSKGLTHQQSIISILLSQKISEDIICDILSISPLTLETHIRNILKRMNINSKHELIYIIRQNNKTIMPYDNK